MQINLPYFDVILARLESGDPEFEKAFGRHIHFGAWEDPDNAYDDVDDSIVAMERLCQHLLKLAEVRDGQDILDVGCGIGGTLASIDEKFSPVRLTGLNIDDRQLRQARKRVTARAGNQVEFVHADACAMPFADASFDRVLAVECVFHFPSRLAFFEHVRRVLRPGGNLTMTDFVQPEGVPAGLFDNDGDSLWGPHTAVDLKFYHELADRVGLVLTQFQDISRWVRPAYHFFGKVLSPHLPTADDVTQLGRFIVDAGALAYCTLRFDLKAE